MEHAERHRADKKYYNSVRAEKHSTDPVIVAARFIYLNRTCYNGLYRVNKKGLFNVPRGSYVNPTICDSNNLLAASQVLAKATITYADFSEIQPAAGDFVYCDPPYDQTFTGYASGGFTEDDQRRLRDCVDQWRQRGASVMVSSSDTALIRRLYGTNYNLNEVTAPRNINSDAENRGPVPELIITTY